MVQTPFQYSHPSVWRGAEMASRDDWIYQLDEAQIDEIEAALAVAKATGKPINAITRDDFPLPSLEAVLAEQLHELENGRGFTLLRGLPIERYSKADAALIYWGIGMHLGRPVAQNAQGELLGHVRNLGADFTKDPTARGYHSGLGLPFHCDPTDVVGLMCLRKAKAGGLSRIVSSTAAHNELAAHDPALWETMCAPFYRDRRGEESDGQKPYYTIPCFNFMDSRLYVFFNPFVESAQRFEEVPRMTDLQRAALKRMDEICNDPAFYLEMELQPGDIQLLCNYVTLHSRTLFEDWSEPDRKRHLLRLWLRTPGFGQLPPAYADRNADMDAWERNPRSSKFDTSEIAKEFAS